jgi:hypothetical protein
VKRDVIRRDMVVRDVVRRDRRTASIHGSRFPIPVAGSAPC